MANRLKYKKAADFEAGINEYFENISAEEPVMRTIFDGTDEDGKKIYRVEPVLKPSGAPLTRTVWYTPPTIGGLCLYLGISRKTLGEYAARGGAYGAAVSDARSIVAAYLEEKISDPDIRNVKGVQLALQSLLNTLEEESRVTRKKYTTADYAEILRRAMENGFISAAPEETDDEDGDE